MDTITLHSEVHGTYQCTPHSLHVMMRRYLPAKREELEQIITERLGDSVTYPLSSVTEGLMILAELDGYGTN